MTESEAKKKWCPMVRDISVSSGNFNISGAFCKGGGCMMWRWENPSDNLCRQAEAVGFVPPHNTIGYCGLAGKL